MDRRDACCFALNQGCPSNESTGAEACHHLSHATGAQAEQQVHPGVYHARRVHGSCQFHPGSLSPWEQPPKYSPVCRLVRFGKLGLMIIRSIWFLTGKPSSLLCTLPFFGTCSAVIFSLLGDSPVTTGIVNSSPLER